MEILYSSAQKIDVSANEHVRHQSMKILHSHSYYEIYYLTEGRRKYFIDSALYQVDEGDVIVIPPNTLHRSIGDDAGVYSRILINVPAVDFEGSLLPEFTSFFDGYFYKIPQKRRKYFDALIEKILYEYGKKDRFSDYLLHSHVNELLIFLTRVRSHESLPSPGNETDKIIGKAARFIRDNFDKPLTLEDTASAVGISKTYFSRLFKAKTGFGFSDYLAQVRVSEAARLLTDTGLGVTEIALRCGYGDSSYFATVFRRYKGMTPVKYRHSANL